MMSAKEPPKGTIHYQDREAVAVFNDEASLQAAVDSLMQFGLREGDISVLGDVGKLAILPPVKELEDSDNAPRTNYASSDSRVEGLAALAGAPALIAGFFAAAVVGSAGAALIPAIAVTVGSSAAGGALGFMLARAFGRRHASYVEQQIRNGGLILWVHAPDSGKDAKIVEILKGSGGRDVHFHVANRTWGTENVPFHDSNPDPLLRG